MSWRILLMAMAGLCIGARGIATAAPSFDGTVERIQCWVPSEPPGDRGAPCTPYESEEQHSGFDAPTRITFYNAQFPVSTPLFVEGPKSMHYVENSLIAYLDGNGDATTWGVIYAGPNSILLDPGLRMKVESQLGGNGTWTKMFDVPYRPSSGYSVRALHSDDSAGLQSQITTLQSQVSGVNTPTLNLAQSYTNTAVAGESTARQQGDASTLSSAKSYSDQQLAAETAARKQGDADTLASAKLYTDGAVAAEAAARQSAVAALTTNLNGEISRAGGAEGVLTTNLAGETTRAGAAESALSNRLSSEATRAESAEAAISSSLASEASRAQLAEAGISGSLAAAEATLSSNLSSEITRAGGAEASLSSSLSSEVTRATGAEATNAANLSSEASRAGAAEASLSSGLASEVTARQAADTSAVNGLSSESAARKQGDTDTLNAASAYTDQKITSTLATDESYTDKSVFGETGRAQLAEAGLSSSVASEASRAQAAESALGTSISAEVSRARSAEDALSSSVTNVANGLDGEMTRAKGAESAMSTSLTDETSRAKDAEGTLQSNLTALADPKGTINKDGNPLDWSQLKGVPPLLVSGYSAGAGVSINGGTISAPGLAGEVTRAQGAEAGLTSSLASEQSRAEAAESTEAARAAGAESTLTSSLNTLSSSLSSEISRAQGAEAGLTSSLGGETSRAAAAEGTLTASVGAETAARQAADVANLTSALAYTDAETTRAKAAESTLLSEIGVESSRANAAESSLQSALDAEVAARSAGDNKLNQYGISPVSPVDGQVLTFVAATGLWTPTTPQGGSVQLPTCPKYQFLVSTGSSYVCSVACAAPLSDCNLNPADGCEVNLSTDSRNCGSCGNVCATGLCVNGACVSDPCANYGGAYYTIPATHNGGTIKICTTKVVPKGAASVTLNGKTYYSVDTSKIPLGWELCTPTQLINYATPSSPSSYGLSSLWFDGAGGCAGAGTHYSIYLGSPMSDPTNSSGCQNDTMPLMFAVCSP